MATSPKSSSSSFSHASALSDESFLSSVESAFDLGWRMANERDGWTSAKTTTLAACDAVDKVEWRREGDDGDGDEPFETVFILVSVCLWHRCCC